MLPLQSGSHCTCSGGSDFPVIRGLGKLLRVLLALLRNESMSKCFLGTNRARRLLPFALRKSDKSVPFCCEGWCYSGLQLASSRPAASPNLHRFYREHSAVLLHCAAVIIVVIRVIIRNPSHTNDPKPGDEVTINCCV